MAHRDPTKDVVLRLEVPGSENNDRIRCECSESVRVRELDFPGAAVRCHVSVPVQMFIALGKIVTMVSLTFLIVLFVLKLKKVGALGFYACCVP